MNWKQHWKKCIALGTTVILATTLLAGCGSTAEDNNKLIVGTNATYVPFEFKNDKTGDYDGFDIDFAKAIAKHLNKQIEFKNITFDALIPALNTKEIDIAASGMTITKPRMEKILFSSPYFDNGLCVVSKGSENIKTLADLKGKAVSAQLGSTGADKAHQIEGVTVKEFDHANEALLELKNGGVAAAVLDLTVAQYYGKQHPEEKLNYIVFPETKGYLGLGINKDNKKLQEEVNKAIATMKENGELDALYQKWFGTNAPKDLPVEAKFN